MSDNEIFVRAKDILSNLILTNKGKCASDALRSAYLGITGKKPLIHDGTNKKGFKVYKLSPDYERIKKLYLKDLEKLARKILRDAVMREVGALRARELKRGVDPEALDDMGY